MTLRDDPSLAKTYAGILAASNAVVSRNPDRPLHLAPHPPGFRPPSVAEVPRLVAEAEEIHRAAAAALCHAYETPPNRKGLLSGGLTEKIWRKGVDPECLDDSLRETGGRSRDLFTQLLNSSVAVVTPDVQIETKFGEEGDNISSAEIKDYKLLLSEESAIQVLGRSHPLNWKQGAPALFKSVVPAKFDRETPQRWVRDKKRSAATWQDAASEHDEFIYETAVWPWSESVTLGVENVLRISNFRRSKAGERIKSLRYEYSLERCIRSNYGVVEEELSGMDIDEGAVEGRAAPLCDEDEMQEVAGRLNLAGLRRLSRKPALNGKSVPQRLTEDNIDAKKNLGLDFLKTIQRDGRDQLWLLTISSSKKLRYTVPQYLPADLWASLTWMAPALLYTFINRAVCLLPQFVEKEIQDRKVLQLTQGTEL